MGISTVKTSFSDLLVQKVVEQKEEIDWKRNAAFGAFGCFYLGGVQYAIYVPLFRRMFPNAASFAAKSVKDKMKDVKGIMTVGAQVFLDQCVHHPLMYFPAFYLTRELVMHDKPDIMGCLTTYKANMTEDLLALWKIWVPSTFLNFAFMPMWGRIPWVAGTSLLWTCILSAMRGGDVVHSEDVAGGAITGATLKIMKEGVNEIFTCPVDLDPDMSHICVSASGPDKLGWVSKVARAVAAGGGNVTHSNMLRLGHEFIILMHVAVPPEKQRLLVKGLNTNKELSPLNIKTSSLTRRQTGRYDKPMLGFRIHCVGEDRPGMLAAISEKVCSLGMSVDSITTELRMGKNGQRDFVVNADCTTAFVTIEDKEELDEIFSDLSSLKSSLSLDVLDVRVHH
eukprot:CAMPEP_0113580310 /NCGR_PEP_ID=MMETSP0015_2-20120614/30596_1 /TAXON_ID=2838 /ORGANISM="Odontella" /LENGTH=394 /DNA_ID=CAMNT_0000484473 /DNA_START=217 /DNA_END=1401 /DNA_ORIENTATION=- /assembly_acc=CAM_ASM_000160